MDIWVYMPIFHLKQSTLLLKEELHMSASGSFIKEKLDGFKNIIFERSDIM